METKELVCIGCPLGCALTITMDGPEVVSVAGNTCPKGDAYARKEMTNPTRIVTSSVCVSGAAIAMVSCKTAGDVPKGKIFEVVEALQGITVPAPVAIGDVIVPDVAGTGVAVIATKDVPAV